ncbi:MAG: Integral rane protein TerC [Chloroflexi bacterium]|nr:Integral rane protein TerC [Chloroflexota bacterium]
MFSLDSVITAVGMADEVAVMIAAVVIAVGVMLVAAAPLAIFVSRHPTVKMLALSFLLLIGMSLVADGLDLHVPKGYVYFAMGFSVFVEMLNLRLRRRQTPVHLRPTLLKEVVVDDPGVAQPVVSSND